MGPKIYYGQSQSFHTGSYAPVQESPAQTVGTLTQEVSPSNSRLTPLTWTLNCVSHNHLPSLPTLSQSPTKSDLSMPSPISIRFPSPSETPPPSNGWVKDLCLSAEDKEILESGSWLSDCHISAAQYLLKKQYPHIDSLQNPLLGSRLMFSVMPSEGIQIINHQKHWTCISTISCKPGHVDVYDSLFSSLSSSAVRQICNLLHTKEPTLTVRMRNVQIQSGASDCGLFSIAFVACLCQGKDSCRVLWTQELMRSHLASCFSNQRMSPFPGSQCQISTEVKRPLHLPLYCSCRMPENKMGMAQCTRCREWFHRQCKKIPSAVFSKSTSWHCDACL